MELIILSLLRLIVPLSIIKYPLAGFLLAIGIDALDWSFFPFNSAQDYVFYQTWDKVFDLYFMWIALIVSLSWKDKLARNTLVLLFFLRLVGVVTVEITSIREIYAIFPNVFISFYIFTLLLMKMKKTLIIYKSKLELVAILIVLSIPTLIGEYFVHYLKLLPWQYYWGNIFSNPGTFEVIINQFIWFLIFLSIPVVAFYIKLKN